MVDYATLNIVILCHVFVFVSSCCDGSWPGTTGNIAQYINSDHSILLSLSPVSVSKDGKLLSEIEKVLDIFLVWID